MPFGHHLPMSSCVLQRLQFVAPRRDSTVHPLARTFGRVFHAAMMTDQCRFLVIRTQALPLVLFVR